MESGVEPVVLVLDPRGVGPAHHHDGQDVGTVLEVRGQVELRGEPRVLAHADEGAVHPDQGHALGPTELQHDPSPPPGRRDGELGPVEAGRVVDRHLADLAGERHLDVRVARGVTDVLAGPAAGDGHGAPPLVVEAGPAPALRGGFRAVDEQEAPVPVQGPPPRRVRRVVGPGQVQLREGHQRGPHRQPTDGGDLGLGPQALGHDRVDGHRSTLTSALPPGNTAGA